ncbi:MAG TPA: hypothetical protein VFP84_35525, partial [Kofleriaceae bacterium]|nr:hypothetical protein [Kofleriaceae bacterium]
MAGVAHDVARPAPGKRTLVDDAPDDATPDRAAGGGVPAWRYVEQTLHLVLAAIGARIARVGLVAPHPHLTWAAAPRAASMISAAIRAYVEAAPGRALKRLMMLAQPTDLSAVVDAARNGRPGTAWLPEVGLAVGEAFDAPLVAAVHRMGARLRAQLDGDAHGVMPARGALLVASCPLDAVIADVLVAPGLVVDRGAGGGGGGVGGVGVGVGAGGDALPHGAVEVEYEWLGARDPALWNWIRVTSPRDATAEHVARTPLAGGIVLDGSEQAHRIAASPPYFAIPIETARLVPAAWKHAPDTVKAAARRGDLGPRFADGGALAESTLADEAALAQASGGVAIGGVASGRVARGRVASGGVASGG